MPDLRKCLKILRPYPLEPKNFQRRRKGQAVTDMQKISENPSSLRLPSNSKAFDAGEGG